MGVKTRVGLVLLMFVSGVTLFAQPGVDGSRTISSTGNIVNAYTPLLATANSGTFTISADIASLNNGTNLQPGSLILIIGMQGAEMQSANTQGYGTITDYKSAGLYEFAFVCDIESPSTIVLQQPLANMYLVGGRNRVQVVRVPSYSNLTVQTGASITGTPWDGTKGGVVAIHASGPVTLDGLVVADSIGFRGGARNTFSSQQTGGTDYVTSNSLNGGEKGEGIYGNQTDYDNIGGRYSRGAPANGGGGGSGHNAGGGGGSNGDNGTVWNGLGIPDLSGGAGWVSAWNLESSGFASNSTSGGGRGGYSYGLNNRDATIDVPGNTSWGGDYRRNVGGQGGKPLLAYSNYRIFLGGGGGAGDANNQVGTAGAKGGGIVIMVADNISGAGGIRANGANALSTSGIGKDGAGGGGAGGSVIVKSTVANTITIMANGGNGGNQNISTSESEGPGGGGGGGYIAIAAGNPSMTANGGLNGVTTSPSLAEFPPNGATKGASGKIDAVATDFVVGATIDAPASICPGGTDTITAHGGNSYVWNTGETTSSIVISTGGTYTVTISCGVGFSFTASVSVNTSTGLTTSTLTTDATCGSSDGAASVTVSGGDAPYTYVWSNGATTATVVGLSPGNYLVTVTAANGCTGTAFASVNGLVGGAIDTNICVGNTLMLEARIPGVTYSWSTQETTRNVVVSSAGVYTVTMTSGGCTVVDTFNVTSESLPPAFSLGNDTSYCGSFVHQLSTGNTVTYWNTGVTAAGISVNLPGVYWAQISNNCGVISDSITISQIQAPGFDLGSDLTWCPGQSFTLNAPSGFDSYLWNDGSTGTSIIADNVGFFWVEASYQGCLHRDSVIVSPGAPPQFSLGPDTTVCGNEFLISLNLEGMQYNWQDNSTDSFYRVTTGGTYSVTVTNACGSSTDQMHIDLHPDYCALAVPTAFSPNNDGKNDVFRAIARCGSYEFVMRIYNRWGELVYESYDINGAWDGTFQNIEQPLSVFVYYIQYYNYCESKLKSVVGNVTLVR